MTATAKSVAARRSLRRDAAPALPERNIGVHRRPEPSGFHQWRALSGRTIRSMIRDGDLFVAVLAPLIFTIGFYLPLKFVMQIRGIDYAQFLMPIIVMQAMAFTAITASQVAASETANGFTTRLKTMPVPAPVPLIARMTSSTVRAAVSLTAGLVFGHVIGFRFTAGFWQAVAFCAFGMLIGITLSLGADAIGSLSKSPEATAQALALPQLILGMLSCGFVPEEGFPEWIRPFVRNQPISQFSFAMRDMAEGGITASVLLPAALWCAGLLVVCAPLAVWASVRRE